MTVRAQKPATAPDPDQLAVINASESSIRIVAPAGSGKTETLARRVQARLENGIAPQRILVLTFDNNARQSFASKLEHLGVPASVIVSTLNAFSYRILNANYRDERRDMVRQPYFARTPLLADLGGEHGYRIIGEMLGKIKNEVIDPRTISPQDLAAWCARNRQHLLRDLENEQIVARMSDRDFGRALAQESASYERFLQDHNGIDFDDQKLRPLLRLQQDPQTLERIQQSFDEVIVDEFQDINKLDGQLIDLLSARATLVITGDDDQAIYGFRGASANYLIHPEKTFDRQFTHYELSTNYRCPPRILETANHLIAHNDHRIEKSPKAAKRVAGVVDAIAAKSLEDEAQRIATRAMQLGRSESGAPRTLAVLTRRNNQLLPLQEQFILSGAPFIIDTRQDIRVTWSLALRILAIAPALQKRKIDDLDARAEVVRVFGAARGMHDRQINRLVSLARNEDMPFPDSIVSALFERERPHFTSGLDAMHGRKPISLTINGLSAFLNADISTAADNGRSGPRLSRLAELEKMAEDFGTRRKGFITHVDGLLDRQREAWRKPNIPRVELSTCHGAKGREWQVVFLPQSNQGIFPDERSADGLYLEAERKLYYVSMTRASEHLITSWTTEYHRMSRNTEPSQFLVEAGLIDPPPDPRMSHLPSWMKPAPAPQSRKPRASRKPKAEETASASFPPRTIRVVSPRGRKFGDGTVVEEVRSLVDRIAREEEEDQIALHRSSIIYSARDPESTLPIQLDLALRGIPFAIEDAHRFTEAPLFQAMCASWETGTSIIHGSLSAATIEAMHGMLRIATSSTDQMRWRRKIEQIMDEEAGLDPGGVQFTTQP